MPTGVSPFELAVGCEVFGVDRPEVAQPWYRFLLCSLTAGLVPTSLGFSIDVAHDLEALATADTVFVPAWSSVEQPSPVELLDALRAAHRRGARMISVCTGAFLLAEAGLLDGRRAATHWMHAEDLARRYPAVQVDSGVLYVDDEDVLTSAGTAAGIDLCLHVVRSDLGADAANAVARRMVVPPMRDGGQAQYLEPPVPASDGDDLLGPTLAWAIEHLDESLSVELLARRTGLSPRHFARRFKEQQGTTPRQWLLAQRVILARRLLETTDEPVDRIAQRCGFFAATGLRPHFRRLVRCSPSSYRRSFRGR